MCSFLNVHSQITVSAVVLDEKGAPISYVTVSNSTNRHSVFTNEEGRFKLDSEPGDVIVICCLGYQEYKGATEKLQILLF